MGSIDKVLFALAVFAVFSLLFAHFSKAEDISDLDLCRYKVLSDCLHPGYSEERCRAAGYNNCIDFIYDTCRNLTKEMCYYNDIRREEIANMERNRIANL